MKLEKVRVTNFRSVDDSGEFGVEQVTCLVGKNEAGKSALLLALAALNPHEATPVTLDKERDYPRRYLTMYASRHPDKDAVAVETHWILDDAEKKGVEALLGPGVLKSTAVKVLRRYGAKDIEYEGPDIDFSVAISHLLQKFSLDETEKEPLTKVTTTSALTEVLGKIATPTANQKALKDHLAKEGSATSQVHKLVGRALPKFMYFSSYDRMDGAVQLENAKSLIANNQLRLDQNRGIRLFVEFLQYAGVSIDDIVSITTYETFNAKLQAASNNITDQILEYWTQNPDLSVEVRVEQARPGDPPPFNSGMVARARIVNALHRVDTPFSERSAGFVWFFSFLVKFAQVKNDSSPVVLLLDEPGLTLHGKAQGELLRFFDEKLAPHHQLIFSTHSPFMVPADKLASVRVVEDQIDTSGRRRVAMGTKVREDVLTRDPDTLFPLQGALGYEITQSLFVGKHTLLLEGPGDILYLQALSDALRRRGRKCLDSRWTMCPAGGIDKISPFISLFAGNELHVAALSDEAKGDKKKIELLKRSAVLQAGHFYTMADFLSREEADIEDFFDVGTFATLLNKVYDLKDAEKLTKAKLDAADPATGRVLKKAEAAFRVMSPSSPQFDHFTPAAWLIRNPAFLDSKTSEVEQSLDVAERVFGTFNGLL